jgi:hypothetical protein
MLKPSSLDDSVVVEFEGGLLAFDFFFAAMVNDDDGKHCELVVDDCAYVTIRFSSWSSLNFTVTSAKSQNDQQSAIISR